MTAPLPSAATPHAAAADPAVALEVHGVPPGTTNAELAALFGPFCSVDKVIVVFEQSTIGGSSDGGSSDGGGGSGSALLLLRPSAAAGAAAQAAAAALTGHQLGGGSLSVQVCSSPAAWVQRALGPQLLIGGGLGQGAAAQQAQQAAGQRAGGNISGGGGGGGGGDIRPKLQRTLEGEPSEFGDELLEEQPSSGSLESLPADFRLLAAITSSPGPGSGLRRTAGGSGSGSLSPHGPHLRCRGSSTASLAGSVCSDGSASECTIVVHNLASYLTAREIGEFFMQFGDVWECHKPQGASFAFVHYSDGAAAARAKEAVHYKLVRQLNPQEALSIQFCKHVPSSRSSAGRAATTERGSSDGGSREGSIADGGGQALVVNNIDPGVQYKEVRAFFSQFGKVLHCYRQPQTRFAFITFSAPEAAVAALQAVDGTLCPELNPHGLVSAEYRRGVGARQSCDGGSTSHASTFHPTAATPGPPGFPGAALPPLPPPYPAAAVVYAPFPPAAAAAGGAPGMAGLNPAAAAWGGTAVAWAGAWPAAWPSPRHYSPAPN